MVTFHDVHRIMRDYYTVYGAWRVDETDLRVWAASHVIMKKRRSTLGVTFAEINGDFGAVHQSLESLEGLPEQLEGDLMITGNLLKNLKGAPRVVKGNMDITGMDHVLKSLEGAPEKITRSVEITYSPYMPMLRCLAASHVALRQSSETNAQLFDQLLLCEEILNDPRWVGKGKLGMLNCALELKKAGLEGNARW